MRQPFSQMSRVCVALGALVGCGSEDSGSPASVEPATSGVEASRLPYAPCAAETLVGQFSIELDPEFTSVGGKVFDAPTPSLIPDQLASDGECRLLRLPNLACVPGCAVSTETCSQNNQCIPLPLAHDVGSVTLSGLVIPVAMTVSAGETRNYSNPAASRLPHPGFEPGADLRLSAGGGDYQAFELRGWGVSLLELQTDPIQVTEGVATAIEWAVPADTGPAHVRVNLDINNHGSSKTWIDCDFADSGSAVIPASLIDALIANGSSGFPTLVLTRETASSVAITPGCVQFRVSSEIRRDVALSGLTSCDESTPCPAGLSCRSPELFCE